jgi:hypothetical protein
VHCDHQTPANSRRFACAGIRDESVRDTRDASQRDSNKELPHRL